MAEHELSQPEDDENDDSDLPPGPHLKPMTVTPALRKVMDQMKEELARRENDE